MTGKYIWTMGLCEEYPVFPNDTNCDCSAAAFWFTDHYTWLNQNGKIWIFYYFFLLFLTW